MVELHHHVDFGLQLLEHRHGFDFVTVYNLRCKVDTRGCFFGSVHSTIIDRSYLKFPFPNNFPTQ